nr:DUF3891 family protein [Paenibacillus stellifer]
MICRVQDEHFVMIKQHDHGLLAAELAARFRIEQASRSRRDEVLYAIANHDRGWIDLDETPFWNDQAKMPYTFIDFPVTPKLTFYRRGLDEIEASTLYGALLCSLHYERLIEVSGEQSPELTVYMQEEEKRRSAIHRRLEESDRLPVKTNSTMTASCCSSATICRCSSPCMSPARRRRISIPGSGRAFHPPKILVVPEDGRLPPSGGGRSFC